MRALLFSVALLTAAAQAEAPAASLKPQKYNLAPGRAFPAFRLLGTDGLLWDQGRLHGHYSFIAFVTADCAECVSEAPDWNALAHQFPDLQFLAFSADGADRARAYQAASQLAWPLIAGSAQLQHQLGVKVHPAFALLDPHGKLVAIGTRAMLVGASPWRDWLLARLK